ncbi:hypothetical protein H3H37_11855 [Duganella sp. LX20W]|uniref:Uncharacterized protein n=1 Tax=Rugamonas brunnea TaxID=2758569 RepID=A0A7W2ESC9_9BURK|nr:hypothetical protein [Rugamonas brunnea]MBA5637748.1 hypothetical protein [Rugamonas brunnea]
MNRPHRTGHRAHAARPARASALAALAALALLATAAGNAPAQSLGLGRLFTSPDERISIDMRRSASLPAPTLPNGAPAPGTAAAPAVADAPLTPPEPVQLNGVVRRSNGKSTVWINQVPVGENGAQLRPDQSVKLRLSSGRALVLKPGQSFNPADGTVQEAAGR